MHTAPGYGNHIFTVLVRIGVSQFLGEKVRDFTRTISKEISQEVPVPQDEKRFLGDKRAMQTRVGYYRTWQKLYNYFSSMLGQPSDVTLVT